MLILRSIMIFIENICFMATFNGDELNRIISECILEYISDGRNLATVTESLSELGYMDTEEAADKNKDDETDGRLSDENLENSKEARRRSNVEDFFKRPGVNNAPYAYKLYGVKAKKGKDTNAMKNARKKFSDNVNHATNQNGYPYSFTSPEINRLQTMITDNELSESVVRKVLEKVRKLLSE